MGGKKKYINMFGSFIEPFNSKFRQTKCYIVKPVMSWADRLLG